MTQEHECPNCGSHITELREDVKSRICRVCAHEWLPSQPDNRKGDPMAGGRCPNCDSSIVHDFEYSTIRCCRECNHQWDPSKADPSGIWINYEFHYKWSVPGDQPRYYEVCYVASHYPTEEEFRELVHGLRDSYAPDAILAVGLYGEGFLFTFSMIR